MAIGRTNAGGAGGAALNFKVIGNPQPSTAKENTIWLDVDKINNYYFSATQPENMVDYDVWFPTGTSSGVEFNALKKNGIQVYPISAKQYVGGAWVDVPAKSWQGGAWVSWIMRLFDNGNQFETITGGWTSSGYTLGVPVKSGAADTKLNFNGVGGSVILLGTNNPITLSGRNEIRFVGNLTSKYTSGQNTFGLTIVVSKTKYLEDYAATLSITTVGDFDISIPVNNLDNGDYYISIRAEASASCKGYVTEVYIR